MLRAGGFMSIVLALVLAARLPALGRRPPPPLGRLLALWELWPGYIKECQLLSVVTVNNSSNKTSQRVDPEQSTLKKNLLISYGVWHNTSTVGRNYKNFKTKSEATRRKTDKYKHKWKLLRNNILNIFMNQNKPQRITNEGIKTQVSKKWTGSGKITSTETNAQLIEKARKILKLGKTENTKIISQHKINSHLQNEFKIVEKKTANNNRKQLQRKLCDNSGIFNKCFGTKSSLVNTFLTANILSTVKGKCCRKNLKDLQSILVLNLVKNQIVNESSQNQTKTMTKEKNKCTNERILAFVKQKELAEKSSKTWDWERIGAISRDQHKILTDARKVLISAEKKSQHTELPKYGHIPKEFQEITGSVNNIPSGISSWKRKSERMSTKPYSKNQNILNSMKQRSVGLHKGQPNMKDIDGVYTTGKSDKNNGSIDVLFNSLPEVGIKVILQGKEQRTKTTPKSVDENQRSSTQAMILQRGKENVQEKWSIYKTDSSRTHERKQDTFKTKASRKQKWRGNPVEVHIPKKESTVFRVEGLEYSSRNDHVEPTKLNSVFPTTKHAVSVKQALFTPEIGQAKFSRHVGKMVTHSMSTSWKVKQKYLSFARKDLNVKARRAAVSNKQTVNSKYKKINKRDYLPIRSIYPYKHTSQSVSDGERRKQSTQGESVKVSVDFVNHLVSVLVAGATIVGIAFFALGLAVFYLFYKRRQLFQFLRTIMKDEELPNKFVPIDAQHYKHMSLSQSFHFGKSQYQNVVIAAAESNTTDDFCSVTKTVVCNSSDSEVNFNMPSRSLTVNSRTSSFTSSSSRSIGTPCDCSSDDSTSHGSFSNEIFTRNLNLYLSSIITKERVIIPVVFQSNHSSCDDQENENSTKTFPQLGKARIPKSRLEDNAVISSPFNETLTVVKSNEDITHLPISESAQRSMGNICKSHSLDSSSLTDCDCSHFPEPDNDLNE
ncbi:hypothetical protein DR999_PMT06745 [Platysternon megacephalum]|uniref:Uncharacterized protein n=1 Tax=Platysternon megacephalum TaxID=55544 RepID=A0A4D9EFS8_9SAUR|nr:hypothetical protein DR999_PMT06745 [Platysternon megacephalum]